MKKRILALLMTLGMLLAILPAGVLAAEDTSGTCGENLTWTLEGETLTISGIGYMWNWNREDAEGIVHQQPQIWCRAGIKSIKVEEGIIYIGADAFLRLHNVECISLPSTLQRIGTSAFSDCSNLKEITIPDGVTYIGSDAFSSCSNLMDITIPNSVTYIGSRAFSDCSNLKEITIPDGVTDISYETFYECSNLKEIKIPDSVTYIGSRAFSDCSNLKEITIPDGVTCIDLGAFYECSSLTSVSIPGSVKELRGSTFSDCINLSNVTIQDGVIYIHDRSFYNCRKLKSVTIPKSVTIIYSKAFGYGRDPYTLDTIKYDDFIIYGYSGTAAETYAKDNGFPFIPLDDPIVFDDVVEGAYYAEAVAWAVAKGITNGTSETTFSPNNGCTRAQAVTFLWRAAGSPEPKSSDNPFTDVKNGSYYEDAVLWAVENDITNGVKKDRFAPNSTCTRAQIVTFLYRFADQPAVSGAAFPDVPEDSYYADAVRWAVANNITNGNGGNFFSPQNTCTRGQIVTFLYRDLA